MASRSVEILIKARDEASKKFGGVGVSSKIMGATLKATARGISGAFRRTFSSITVMAKMAFSSISSKFKQMVSFTWQWAKRAGIAFGLFSGYAVKLAMDAEESENLFTVSMGRMADATRKWSEEMAKSLGLNAYGIRRMVSTLNVMLSSMGIAPEKAAEMSQSMTKLTYDMASFYNLKVDEAFQKLQSGITGEMEPLKRLGILVGENTIKAWALREGIIKKGQALTEAQKVFARYNVILEQTQKAQGDLERTSSSTTNVFRALKEQVKLLGIEYGRVLLPAVTRVAERMKEFLIKNRERIVQFAEKALSAMTLVKDIFVAYIDFMRQDWREGFSKSLDATIVLFKAWGQSLKVVFEKIFTDIGYNISTWLYNAMQWRAARTQLIKNVLEESGWRTTYFGKPVLGPYKGEGSKTREAADLAYKNAVKEAERILSIYGPEPSGFYLKETKGTTPWKQVGDQIKAINKEALDKIKDIMPEFAKDVEKAFADHRERLDTLLKEPAAMPATGTPPGSEKKPGPSLAAEIKQSLQASEARLLTMAPGTKIDYAKQTAQNTKEHLHLLRQQIRQTSKFIEKAQSIRDSVKNRGFETIQVVKEKQKSESNGEDVFSRETAVNTRMQLNKESEIAKTLQKILSALENIRRGGNNSDLSFSSLG